MRRLLRTTLLSCLAALPCPTLAATAQLPIEGGLGVRLGEVLSDDRIGAEVITPAGSDLPANRTLELPTIKPGGRHPWRYLAAPQLPRLYREQPYEAYVMLNGNGEVMRAMARIGEPDCGASFDWLKKTISKKYDADGDAEVQPAAPFERALRLEFSNRQIDVRCGPELFIDYLDVSMLALWADTEKRRYAQYMRDQSSLDQRKLVLKQRKQKRFADTFTLGDRFRLDGAFGIRFEQPFAKNSTQRFPIDEPFYAVLPNMPEPFDNGDLELTISPAKHPIVIRGRFQGVDFDHLADALKSKYGLPMKASSRHIIHKVNGDHVVIKRLQDNQIELAFIDSSEQAAQRQRLWNKESEGL